MSSPGRVVEDPLPVDDADDVDLAVVAADVGGSSTEVDDEVPVSVVVSPSVAVEVAAEVAVDASSPPQAPTVKAVATRRAGNVFPMVDLAVDRPEPPWLPVRPPTLRRAGGIDQGHKSHRTVHNRARDFRLSPVGAKGRMLLRDPTGRCP